MTRSVSSLCFFFNDTATTEIYTLSLHDALPISIDVEAVEFDFTVCQAEFRRQVHPGDRKSTRLNSSHSQISYAVFCLKKQRLVCVRHRPCDADLGRLSHEEGDHLGAPRRWALESVPGLDGPEASRQPLFFN